MLDFMSHVPDQLAAAPDLETLLGAVVHIMKDLTGSHRVMIQRVDGSSSGCMVVDLVDPVLTQVVKEPDLSVLNIPWQPRMSGRVSGTQLLYDRDLADAQLLYRPSEAPRPTLDLTGSYLCVTPPSYTAHAESTNAQSLMVVSIDSPTGTWGLIVCHYHGAFRVQMSFASRRICRYVSDVASRSIQKLLNKWRVQSWQNFHNIFTEGHIHHSLGASTGHLLRCFQADFGFLSIGPKTRMLGQINRVQECLVLLEYFKKRKARSVIASFDIEREFLKLKYPLGFRGIAGILVIPLIHKPGGMFLLFRRSQPLAIKNESWSEREIEAATVLCSVPIDLVSA
jgi:light-regulated signal transduction histidine kinase (bacteriophytochrome)